jgi:hypothetical protein
MPIISAASIPSRRDSKKDGSNCSPLKVGMKNSLLCRLLMGKF